MDKIWYRNPSKSAGMKKPNDHAEPTKNAKKNLKFMAARIHIHDD